MKRAVGGFVAGVLLTCVGCSLSLDPDQFAPPRQGLLPPSLRLGPDPATVAEDLVVTVENPVSDEYRFAWTRTREGVSEDVAIGAATVPATELRKGDLWEVRVTPVSDGEEGYPATGNITIQNAPPELTTAWLSTYRPVAGDRITGAVGSVFDPDLERDPTQESIGYRFEWSRVRGGVETNLVTVNAGFGEHTLVFSEYEDELAPGDGLALRVVAWDSDQVESAVEVGPAQIIEGGTQWVQLLPDRTRTAWGSVYDSQHDRVLLFEGESLWEYSLDRDRFVQLYPAGHLPQAVGGIRHLFAESQNNRMILLQSEHVDGWRTGTYVLDTSRRGREEWLTLDPEGPSGVPGARTLESTYHDIANQRLYVWGGIPPDGPPDDPALWMLNLVPGQETWTRLDLVGEPAPLTYFGSFLAHPSEERVAWLGGAIVPSESEPVPFGSAYEIDLTPRTTPDDGTRTLTRVSVGGEPLVMDPPVLAPVTFTDRERGRALFGLGAAFTESGFSQNSLMWEYDFDTGGTTLIGVSGSPQTGGSTSIEPDPRSNDYVVVSGRVDLLYQASFNVWRARVEPTEVTWSPIHRYGTDLPPAIAAAAVGGSTRAFTGGGAFERVSIDMFGGESGDGKALDQVWVYELESRRWRAPPQRPDALTMRLPGPRTGFSATFQYLSLSLFGGVIDSQSPVVPAAPDAWFGYFDPNAGDYVWTELVESAESPEELRPEPTMGMASATKGCGFVVVGGAGNGGATRVLECVPGGDCAWTNPVSVDGELPSANGHALGQVQGVLVALGGSLTDVYELSGCSGAAASWDKITDFVPGPRPTIGSGARMVDIDWSASILLGGTSPGDGLDAWKLSKDTGIYAWEELAVVGSVPPERAEHIAAPLSEDGRTVIILYGGRAGSEYLSDMWELRLED